MHDTYESPLLTRYASREMAALFSPHHRAVLYRRLWLSLATHQKALGLPITDHQLGQLRLHIDDIAFDKIQEYEKRFRHDVMAHIHAYGDQCLDAKAILHLGATSTFVTDNADLIQLKQALQLLLNKLTHALRALSTFAQTHAHTPCLGATHYQAAQPTTVGKRACLWLQDLLLDAHEWERLHRELPFLGVKGATGTQASFLALFEGDPAAVATLESNIARDFHFEHILPICGQTYPRKIDLLLLQRLAAFGAGVHKMATDLRLLAHDGEIAEDFQSTQVGSSAMPYKRNPIYAERLCGLARYLMSLSDNPAYTLATQWLERTLDDSSNRRLVLPDALLTADALLNILIPLIEHLHVDTHTTHQRLTDALPHLAMENILMQAVKQGASRQDLHEKLRLLRHPTPEQLATASGLTTAEVRAHTDINALIGLAPAQTLSFLAGPVAAFLKRHPPAPLSLPPLEI